MRRIAFALALLAPAVAAAEPRFDVVDRGDTVEIIGHDITTARTTITAARQRLEIPLPAGAMPIVKRVIPGDATVLLAEIDPDAHAVSIKLTLDHAGVVGLARVSQAMQIGNDLHVLVPRKPEGVVLPEPSLPPAVPAVAPRPAPTPTAAVVVAAPTPAAVIAPATALAAAPAATAATPAAPLSSALAADDGGLNPSVFLGAALLAVAGAVWLWRRRKHAAAPATTIDVIAQRALGGKARVVWLALGGRELIVAVTAQHVQLLGAWQRGEPVPAGAAAVVGEAVAPPIATAMPRLPRATTQSGGPAVAPGSATTTGASSAVSGILRLRERTMPPVSGEVATGDVEADTMWARELLAATMATHRQAPASPARAATRSGAEDR